MKLAKYIDHTLLKAEASQEEIETIISEAKDYNFASVCVNPSWVAFCAKALANTEVKVCTVIGFPLGATTSETKVFEAKDAIKNGAEELDLVINIAALKDGQQDVVKEEIQAIVDLAGEEVLTKVIIETSLLSEEEKLTACKLAKEAGADFVKTSTGFSTGGATLEDIKLMRETVGEDMGVKASGGIRDKATALAMIQAGATRIGASAGVAIMNE